ncbi:MAG: response regulator transcription factor [Nitrococcus sp.]|nr:response regulator transcription factor [Nitrococcus sp.]
MSRASVTQLLETSTHAKRRSGDFIILPFANSDALLSCYPDCGVELVILSIGSSSPSDDGVHEDISRLIQGLVGVPLIILSAREEPQCILKALRLGAHSYITTRLKPEVVIQALHLIQVGGSFIPPSIVLEPFAECRADKDQVGLVAPTHPQNFSPRQLEVLQLLRLGRSNKVIAYELNMQESTVKVHVREIMKKLNARNRTQAAFLAFQMDAEARVEGPKHRTGQQE